MASYDTMDKSGDIEAGDTETGFEAGGWFEFSDKSIRHGMF